MLMHGVSASHVREACRSCGLHELCLPLGLLEQDVEHLELIVQRTRPLRSGRALYREGESFHAIYVARAGSVKTVAAAADGCEQVVGFHLPGELFGLDGLAQGLHRVTAQALDTVSVCTIPFDRLEGVARQLPALQHQLLRLMSREIGRRDDQLLGLGQHSPERRLAVLLLSLSQRVAQRGYSATQLLLPMSRQDIASYLGIAPETLSRLLRRLQDRGLIDLDGRALTLRNRDGLHELAGVELAL